MEVRLGPFPLCDTCRERNGGLVATLHRQVHVKVGERESCVDEDLAGLLARVWTVGDTVSACQDSDGHGRAYIVPEPESRERIAALLRSLGLDVDDEDGWLYFRLPRGAPPEPPARSRIDTAGSLPEVLARLSAEVGALRPRLAGATTGLDHARIQEARARLDVGADALEMALRRSVSRLHRPDGTRPPAARLLRAGELVAVMFPVVAAAAWIFDASVAWMAVAAVPGSLLGGWLNGRAADGLDRRFTRARLAAARSTGTDTAPEPDDDAVLQPVGVRLSRLGADLTGLRSTAGTLLVRLLDERGPAAVTGADVMAAADRDSVFNLVLFAEEALAVSAYSLDVWQEASPG
ncbi:hypothetical protein [Virgisporangium aurantiacum]|uniref:Uncharacterized protein n=1 Tax=Virgisporangium aurantiacum TaxID=175570 RepID=A0A8J3Z3A1_9ACTN|nr:hypothetical protein [Virgisporangium aurantiacum]GIJ55907.1 hypothetical protein Vau01_034230 [Virgisporangium aurantiacum]